MELLIILFVLLASVAITIAPLYAIVVAIRIYKWHSHKKVSEA
jgi:hypothetical protein